MAALTQDYQIEWNGLLIGASTPYDIVAILGSGIPNVRSIDVDRLDDHGTYPSRRELMQARTMNFEVDIVATDIPDLHTKIRAFKSACVPTETIRPLTIRIAAAGWGTTSDESCIVFGFSRQLTGNVGELANSNTQKVYWQIEIPDPRVYSLNEYIAFVETSSAVGGWDFPWTFPWTFGAVTSGVVEVINHGIMDTPPVYTITGPATNPRISNLETEEFIEIDEDIIADEFLVLNVRDRTALLNGTGNRYNLRKFGSMWFPLRPGSNILQYSLAAGDGQLEVRWRDAYV